MLFSQHRVGISGAMQNAWYIELYSVPALLLVDCDSPADVLCVVSSCSVAGDFVDDDIDPSGDGEFFGQTFDLEKFCLD